MVGGEARWPLLWPILLLDVLANHAQRGSPVRCDLHERVVQTVNRVIGASQGLRSHVTSPILWYAEYKPKSDVPDIPDGQAGRQAGAKYMEAKTRELAPTQRCHACWELPSQRKELSDREHGCEHCGATCGRDENASRVLMRWLWEELDVAGPAGDRAGVGKAAREGGRTAEPRGLSHDPLRVLVPETAERSTGENPGRAA